MSENPYAGRSIKIRFANGHTEEIHELLLLEVDERPYQQQGDSDAQFEEIARILTAHETWLNQHDKTLAALIAGRQAPVTPSAEDQTSQSS